MTSIFSTYTRFTPRKSALTIACGIMICCCLALAIVSITSLEQRFANLDILSGEIADTPVTQYRTQNGPRARPLAVVVHGFGGSRQVVDQLAVTLARSGFHVAAIDLPGHGRHRDALRLGENSASKRTQMVKSVESVMGSLLGTSGIGTQAVLIGHGLGGDVVIRASEHLDEVTSVVAVSIVSDVPTVNMPGNLLLVNGATETAARARAERAVDVVHPTVAERRAYVVPGAGHLGVLYSAKSLNEIATHLSGVAGTRRIGDVDKTGMAAAALLVALALLPFFLAVRLPRHASPQKMRRRRFSALIVAWPIAPTIGVGVLFPNIPGVPLGFSALAAALGTWGTVQLLWLRARGIHPKSADLIGNLFILCLAFGVLAAALDRYGAAFLPTGSRFAVLATMMLGVLPLALADAAMARAMFLWQRIVSRGALCVTLLAAMVLTPNGIGVTFVAVPVIVAVYLLFGALAYIVCARRGQGAAWIALTVIFAWSCAAVTPMFAP